MSYLKHNTWGRTRQPKAATGQYGQYITGTISLGDLNHLTPDVDFTAANACYRTENQRYAHIACSGSSTVSKVFIYNYAMGFWHELVEINPNNGNKVSIEVGTNQQRIIEINGSDWIAVTGSYLTYPASGKVTMAFSTF
jgi:hypothetical protein